MSKLSELYKKATPGPWRIFLGSGEHLCTAVAHEDEQTGAHTWVADFWPDWMVKEKADHIPDMEFVVALVNAYARGDLVERNEE
jgi:hypothetical protein